jgi:hypothetical protein
MWSQILIFSSIVAAGIFDVKERAVSDFIWLPAGIGLVYTLLTRSDLFFSIAVKIGFIGLIAVGFTVYGAIGQADAIALIFLASDPYFISPLIIFVGAAFTALAHISYIYLSGKGNPRLVTIEKFKKEQNWIPRAIINPEGRVEVSRDVNKAREEVLENAKEGTMVEVTYGVPTIAYLAAGYAVYLAYLVLFNYGIFLNLP